MMAIGLGKFHGAQRYHTYGYNLGMETVIVAIGRQVLKSGKILGGLAILEDANHNTAQLTAVPVEQMEQREVELLALVKQWMGHLPASAHILILDQIGKPISGAGFDTKVGNRGVNGEYNPWPNTPKFHRLFIRDLHPNSYGNGVGLGMADVVCDRLLGKIDWTPTSINSLTASSPAAVQTPLHYSTDRECLERIAPTVGLIDLSEIRICWVKNTLELNPRDAERESTARDDGQTGNRDPERPGSHPVRRSRQYAVPASPRKFVIAAVEVDQRPALAVVHYVNGRNHNLVISRFDALSDSAFERRKHARLALCPVQIFKPLLRFAREPGGEFGLVLGQHVHSKLASHGEAGQDGGAMINADQNQRRIERDRG